MPIGDISLLAVHPTGFAIYKVTYLQTRDGLTYDADHYFMVDVNGKIRADHYNLGVLFRQPNLTEDEILTKAQRLKWRPVDWYP